MCWPGPKVAVHRIDIEFGIAAVRLNLHEIRDDVGAGVVVAVQHVQAFHP